jgi:hypothetical protein
MDRFPVTRLVVAMLVALAALAIPARAVAAEVVDQANVPASDPNSRVGWYAVAQTFTVGKSGRLTSADVWTDNISGPAPQMKVEIRPTDGNGIPTSTVLASATTTITAATAGGSFKLATPPWVIAGEKYALVLTTDNPGASPWYDWLTVGDAYPGGSIWTFSNGSWGAFEAGDDLVFRTHVDTTPDTTKPLTNFAVTGTAGNSGWLRGTPTLAATATDPDSGVAETRCWINPSAPPAYTTAGSQPCSGQVPDGAYTIYAASKDRWGNMETPNGRPFKIDTVAPGVIVSSVPAWSATPPTVTLAASDATSGMAGLVYSVGSNPPAPATVYDSAHPPTLPDGAHLRWQATDTAGNVSTGTSDTAHIDAVAPVTTASTVSPDWTRTPQPVSLTSTDALSGVAAIRYTLGSGTPNLAYDPANKPVLANGQKLRYAATDVAGNVETVKETAVAKVDADPPATTASAVATGYTAAPQPVTLTATDALSGVAVIRYTLGDGDPDAVYDPASKPVLGDGQRLRYGATDVAGNTEAVKETARARVDSAVPDTTLETSIPAFTANASPSIAFSTGAPEAHFECALDGGVFVACSSPFVPANDLADGAHTFAVRTVSRASVPDPSPATLSFAVDTIAPAAPIVNQRPDATTTDTAAHFAFATEENAVLLCALDGAPATGCAATLDLGPLAPGGHTLRVTARDRAGNESEATTVEWTVTQLALAPSPTPTPAPAPALPLTAKALTFTLAGKDRQLLLSKRQIAVVVNCGGVPCSLTVAAEIRVKGKRLKLATLKASLPTGKATQLKLATTSAQRTTIRKLVGRRGTKATLRYTITATGAGGARVTRTGTIALRRLTASG